MRWLGFVAIAVLGPLAQAQSPVGVWKAGLKHGKLSAAEAKKVRVAKEELTRSSLKLHKNKTFGCVLMQRIMKGNWSLKNGVLTLSVKEVIGMSAKQVAAMPARERTAQLKFTGKQLIALPVNPGRPNVVWKKIG